MTDERARYLIIDSTEIHRQLYNKKREFAFNDWDTVCTPDRVIDAKEIFDKYRVPEEFQKIIIKIDIPFCIRYGLKEYITGLSFAATSCRIKKEGDDKYISAFSRPILDTNHIFENSIWFNTRLRCYKPDKAFDFLSQMRDKDHLKSYLGAITEFFSTDLDLDFLGEVYLRERKVQKALEFYRKKDSHKE